MLRYNRLHEKGVIRRFSRQQKVVVDSKIAESVGVFFDALRERLTDESNPLLIGRYSQTYFTYIQGLTKEHQQPEIDRAVESEAKRRGEKFVTEAYRLNTDLYERVRGRSGSSKD